MNEKHLLDRHLLDRHSYTNTASNAGSPQRVTVDARQIDRVATWTNAYGNPSYVYHMKDGTTHYLVDDYGAMNGINARLIRVRRRKDMFNI